MARTQYDKETIKREAAGRWPEIATSEYRIGPEFLSVKHGPCPRCGGTDRWMVFDDFAQTGGAICNQCGTFGDGIDLGEWWLSEDFKSVLHRLAVKFGHASQNGNGHANGKAKKKRNKPPFDLQFIKASDEASDILLAGWCMKKPPITVAALKLCGAKIARYRGGEFIVVALPQFGENRSTCGWTIYSITGGTLPAYGKKGPPKYTKVLQAPGSKSGLIASVDSPAGKVVWKCEGPPDMLALMSQPDRLENHVAVTNASGTGENPKWMVDWFSGAARCNVNHDADIPGQSGAGRWSEAIANVVTDTRNVQLGYPLEKNHGKDLRDWFNEGHTFGELLALAEQSEPVSARRLPKTIYLGTDESRVIDESLTELAKVSGIFQRGGQLVHVVQNAAPPAGLLRSPAPRIRIMEDARAKELLSTAATFMHRGEAEDEVAATPAWVVRGIAARGQWQEIPAVDAVIEAPALRPDGTIIETPGFDRETGTYFHAAIDFLPTPENPTHADACESIAALKQVIIDFPFKGDEHRAAAICGMLTPFARLAFTGPSPLNLVDGNMPGTGKGLLVDAITLPFAGREIARMANPKSDEECRKKITSIAMAGESMVLVDNVAGPFGCPSLDAALTATTWNDRILSTNEMTGAIPLAVTWYCTVNNCVLAADTVRRSLHVRLESPVENPEERTGFDHPDLLAWMKDERPVLVRHCLTILRAYFVAGRPDQNLPTWGSFEGWSRLVRSAVVWAGMADPSKARKELASQADREGQLLRQLVAGWLEIDALGSGISIAAVYRALDAEDKANAEGPAPTDMYPVLRAVLAELSKENDKRPTPQSLGMKLHHLRGRIIDGKHFACKPGQYGAEWSVRD